MSMPASAAEPKLAYVEASLNLRIPIPKRTS